MTQSEADEALRRAILDHAAAYDLADDDEMLSDFAVVAHWQPVVEDGESRYTTHFARSPCPSHVAVGLFTTGARLVVEGGDE